MPVADLLSQRLLVVTGKGGVGKSTVAAALAVLGARAGKRTVLAEVGRRGDVPALLRGAAGDAFAAPPPEDDRFHEEPLPLDLGPGAAELRHVSVSPEAALREYLRDQLPVGAVADLLLSGRVFTAFTAATPGMRELLAMGKVWELSQPTRRTPGAEPYDLCVMDAPASGHALTILGAPAQFARTARVGPIARQGGQIGGTIADPAQTAAVVVATGEELPVAEALELAPALAERVGVHVALGVANGLLADRFSAADREALRAGAAGDPALRVAAVHAARAADQARQLARLRAGFPAPVVALPASAERRLGAQTVLALADVLAAALDAPAAGGERAA
ncbi:ArsA-related P-loop ATPase [Patulibacter sp. SYSU D01012]|uniref:ArsA-related P-loop ATPase n=1 Tax=Patulibacter sp. SYSU D01012 TaxID=2817381 RepID=UPI001B30A981|nr:ArsA-related P-loop ATPase [Patulibacter sp. SYSU D01012]